MKKIFTLLFAAVGMIAVAQAQSGQRGNQQNDQRGYQQNDQRGFENKPPIKSNDVVIYGNDGRYNDRVSMERKKAMEIAQINREYDLKVQKVQRNFFLTWFAKQKQIRSLEQQRQFELKMVNAKYSKMDRYDDHDGRYNDHDGRSNGRY